MVAVRRIPRDSHKLVRRKMDMNRNTKKGEIRVLTLLRLEEGMTERMSTMSKGFKHF